MEPKTEKIDAEHAGVGPAETQSENTIEEKTRPLATAKQAQKAVLKALDVDFALDAAGVVHEGIATLYERYEADGTRPTKESLSELPGIGRVDGGELANAVRAIEGDPFAAPSRRGLVVGIVAGVVVLALAGAGIAFAMQPKIEQTPAQTIQSKTEAVAVKDEAKKSSVALTIKAEGAESAAAKAKVIVAGSGKIAIAEREVGVNAAVNLGDLDKGDYELMVTSAPVLADGSTYKLPESPVKFSVDGKGKVVEVESALSKIAKEDMTKEQLEAAAALLASAGNADAAAQVKQQAQSAPSVAGSADQIQKPSTGGETSGGGISGGGSSSGDTGSGGTGSGGATTPEPPAHTHNWVAQTSQQWKPNVVWVEDSAAWDEWVISGSHIETSCGKTFATAEEWFNHQTRSHSCSYSVVDERSMVHHEATGHDEDQGHYETVTTGYICSCGATK